MATGLVVVMTVGASPQAAAYWVGLGTGSGTAQVLTLDPIPVTASVATWATSASIDWTAPELPVGMSITGYYVTRDDGSTIAGACASSPGSLVAPSAVSCTDTGVPDGEHVYSVTAVAGSWTTSGSAAPVTVARDLVAPTVAVSGDEEVHSHLGHVDGSARLYFRPGAAGSIRLVASVSDAETGPSSATFPTPVAAGWTHATETVTAGAGAPPAVAYTSTAYSFSAVAAAPAGMSVTATDGAGNVGQAAVVFVADSVAPGGGALIANGTAASAGGSGSVSSTGAFTVASTSGYTEPPTTTASGLASTALLRSVAALAGGTCGSFGSATTAAAPLAESGLDTGCYRYSLTGTDQVGNVASVTTTVRVDTTAPIDGVLTVNGTTGAAPESQSGATAPNWSIARTAFADPESDPTMTTLSRTSAALSGGSCGAYGSATTIASDVTSEGSLATGCYRYVLGGTNSVGLSSSLATVVRLDTTSPTGGALTVNGAAASTGGTSSTSTTGSFQISALTAFSDAESGMAGTTIKRHMAPVSGGICGAFDPDSELQFAGTAPIPQAGLAPGCYRYTLTGTNAVGGASSIGTTVRVDSTPPEGGALSVNAVEATPGGSISFSTNGSWGIVRTEFTDPQTPLTSSTLVRTRAPFSNGTCGAYTQATTISGAPGQSNLGTYCYRYVLTGTNALNVSSSISTVVRSDTTAASAGVLAVNGVTATAAGTTSNSGTGAFSVGSLTNFSDGQSGIAGQELTVTRADLGGGTCGAFVDDEAEPLTGPAPIPQSGLATGCYRYRLQAVNGVGRLSSLTTTVRVDRSAPVGGALTVNGVAADVSDTLSVASTVGWSIARTSFSDPDSATTTTALTRAFATYSGGACGAFGTTTTISTATTTEGTLSTGCYRYVLTGTNSAGLVSRLSTVVRLDRSVPAGGALSVNGAAASGAGTSSTSTTGTFTVSVLTAFTDPDSGMVDTVLTRLEAPASASTCGTFDPGSSTEVTGALPISQSGLDPGCYRYLLTGRNASGGVATVSTTVRVDTTAPVAAVLSVNGVDAAPTPTTSTAIAPFAIVRTDFSDPETTMTSSTLVRTSASLLGGVCGTSYLNPITVTGAPTQSGLASACYRYVLTGTNSLTLAASVTTIVALDSTLPTSGAFSVNGIAATGAGSSSSIAANGSFSITGLTPYADGQSGLASSTLTRTTGVSTAGVCGTFDDTSTVTLSGGSTIAQPTMPSGCYRYVLTGVNGFGGTIAISSTVRVGP